VHLLVRVDPTDVPASVVRAFRGHTARVLRQEFPHLPNHAKVLWSTSYFAASVGKVSESTVRRSIEHQWDAVLAACGARTCSGCDPQRVSMSRWRRVWMRIGSCTTLRCRSVGMPGRRARLVSTMGISRRS
jgi:hypothetical protein